MTPAQFAHQMESFTWIDGMYQDAEDMHIAADKLMCRVLTDLGYGEGIAIFYAMDKWYA